MVDKVNERQAKFLMYLLLFVLSVMTFVSGWSKYESTNTAQDLVELRTCLPKDYITSQRYYDDKAARTTEINALSSKMDKVNDKIEEILKIMLRDKSK